MVRAVARAFWFQSTHPVWDATGLCGSQDKALLVSIHAPRMGCDPRIGLDGLQECVSIHAPRMGCDTFFTVKSRLKPSFNPRTPYGMRLPAQHILPMSRSFNPRTPYGMRPRIELPTSLKYKFQSTHPVWDATAWKLTVDGQWCSCRFAPTCSSCCYFQVRSFYSNDVNVLNSRLYENRWSAGNFL